MPDSMLNVDDWIVPLTAEQPRIVPPETAPPEVAAPVESPALKGRFVAHPRYRAWLAKCGVTSADVAYNLPGEVVSGHPDRHVVRVELYAGASRRRVYLKREHVRGVRSRWRNWLAGFGRVSRCEREAATLDRLERAGLAAPQWLAHGEDAFGRAFLIVDDVPDAIDLREFLQEYSLNEEDRRVLAERLGAAIAEFHLAGFGTPELCAKHVLIHPKSHAPTLIDWQSCGSPHRPTADEAHRSLAALHATLRGELAGPRERLRFLWAYRRVLKFAKSASVPSWREAIAAIEAASRGLVRKS